MDYKKRFLLNDLVKGRRIFNNEVVEGRFNGFHLYNKLDPTSVVGVICVEGDRCYDIVAESIELLESEDEKIRKAILELVRQSSGILDKQNQNKMIDWLEKQDEKSDYNPYKATVEAIADMVEKYAPFDSNLQDFYDNIKINCKDAMEYDNTWLEKQDEKVIDCPQNHQDVKHPNCGIILEDFNGGEGFYKLNLDYLNKKQVAEIEELVKTWNTELNSLDNENIRACIGMCLTDADEQRFKNHNTNLKECIAWLDKQGEQKPIECNADDLLKRNQIMDILQEYNRTELMAWLEKQGEQKPAWSEKDEELKNSTILYMQGMLEGAVECENIKDIKEFNKIISWLKSIKKRMKGE